MLVIPISACFLFVVQHNFKAADDVVSDKLLPSIGNFSTMLDADLAAATDVMQCCSMRHVNTLTRLLLYVLASTGGAAVLFVLLVVGLCAKSQRKRALSAMGLPTYGLPTYSSKSRAWQV